MSYVTGMKLLVVAAFWPALVTLAAEIAPESSSPRQIISLVGDWQFQRDGAKSNDWKAVRVPSTFDQHEGTNFHGVGWYHKTVPPFALPAGKRALVHFQAAATEAEVWWNGVPLGTHLGGWTPFRFDITDLVRKSPASGSHELRVRVDEKVGHNSQGFLPIIAPHFGGLWQEVQLLVVPDTYCDDLRLLAVGDLGKAAIRLDIPMAGTLPSNMPPPSVRYRLKGEPNWITSAVQASFSEGKILAWAPLPNPRPWSPAEPNLYELQIGLAGDGGDRLDTRAGFRTMEVFGPQLRLNGQPLQIRGVLNWGYSAPLTAPNPGEETWRKEIEFARGHGFNLMKFCLWIPPRRYYELADELGLLTWAEYPTWHPSLTQKFLEPLRREFSEFFHYDRNHPSIILRSLTCETGPGAELPVIQNLYDLAKATVPGALVEDDSSWIGWNRAHDFYDDHPYGNNQTWVETLQGFNEYVLAHGLKPLVLGEAIAADTWIDREAVLKRLGTERPWWAPGPIDAIPRWLDRARAAAGPGGLDRLREDSFRYGLLTRKYQTEAFRREVPAGGYVISVIRDVPICSMGLIDYLGQSKWSEADWVWQRDTLCLLKTELDRRAFASGGRLRGELLLSHFGNSAITNGELDVTLESGTGPGEVLQRWSETNLQQNLGTLAKRTELDWPLPPVTAPKPLVLRTRLRVGQAEYRNEWPLWVVPAPRPEALSTVRVHTSLATETARELFPAAPQLSSNDHSALIVAARLDEDLVQRLEAGERILLLPDGQRHSLPLGSHWFLRGAPYLPDHGLLQQVPRSMLVDLQAFDLSSQVIPNVNYLEHIDPVLMLWDTHDLKLVKTHGLIFETRAAKGRLLVSAVNHSGSANPAGRWLLQALLDHLNSAEAPRNSLPAEMWANLKNQMHAERTNLVACTWRFQPDPKNEGLNQGWHQKRLTEGDGWKDIHIGEFWDSQGYADLDGWAWYRLSIDIPARWQGHEVFLSFEGVDDFCEVYVNGDLAGKNGDLAARKTAFEERISHNITRFVKPGEAATIAVRVYDWGGAGGIFRPVTLSTMGFSQGPTMLK